MKTKILKLSIIILLFSLIGAGCEKENEELQLPPITQSGAGTLGCLVNGEIFVAKNWMFGPAIGASNNQWEDRRWVINGVGDNHTVVLEICRDLVIKGEAILKGPFEESCSNSMIYFSSYPSLTASFQTSDKNVGKVFISRFDTTNRIISGTFYFDAVNSSGEKVEIRDGRFDVKFINYEP